MTFMHAQQLCDLAVLSMLSGHPRRPAEFEAEGIDGISNGQQVDLRTVPKVDHSAQMQEAAAKPAAVLNQSFYDSDEEEEEHMLGCACCPGGRNVVFRVY